MVKRAKPRSSRSTNQTRPARTGPKKSVAQSKASPVSAGGQRQKARPQAEAVAAFESAMQAMQAHRYSEADRGFRTLIDTFPRERALLDRARVYRELCRRELDRAARPQTLEERLTAATAALNDDDEPRAEELAKGILTDEPEHDIALYLLAAVEARRGRPDSALAYLAKAVAITPEAGARARLDEDFDTLREHDEFHRLTEPPPAPVSGEPRRDGRRRP